MSFELVKVLPICICMATTAIAPVASIIVAYRVWAKRLNLPVVKGELKFIAFLWLAALAFAIACQYGAYLNTGGSNVFHGAC